MAVRGSFSSAFTRRNCSHEKVFHSEYQRTNRTKENKILRCFPHCCPEHVRRSYCGSSLHLQVDFHAGDVSSPSATFRQPTRDDDLLVFGRFRPRESRGFRVGDRIAGAAILSSLQSEDNPTGEWIEAWLVASADRNAWLYEVNHSARWYYNWGSSAAKDKRLKEHVFEVYILYQSSELAAGAVTNPEDGRSAADSFQVAAVSCSPPFKLLSFRRAPAETRKRGHADANTEQLSLSEEETPSRDTKRYRGRDEPRRLEEEEEKEPRGTRPWAPAAALARAGLPPQPIQRPMRDNESPPVHNWEGSHHQYSDRSHRHAVEHKEEHHRHGNYHRDSEIWRSPPRASAVIPAPSFSKSLPSVHSSSSIGRLSGSTLPSITFSASSTTATDHRTRAPSFPTTSSTSLAPIANKRPRYDVSPSHPLPHSLPGAVHNSGNSAFSSMWRHSQQDLARFATRSPSPSPHPTIRSAAHSERRRQRTQLEDITHMLAALRAITLADATVAVPSLETTFRQYVARIIPVKQEDDYHRTRMTKTPLMRESASRDVERVLSHLNGPSTGPRPRHLPSGLVDVATHLALWLQCDPSLVCARAVHLERAASVLLNKPALAEAHERFVRWLYTQIDTFLLRRCGWSLEAFAMEITHALRTAQRNTGVEFEFDHGSDVAAGSGVAFTDFVAQAREVFLNDQPRELQRRDQVDRLRPSRLDGLWHSELSRVCVRRLGPFDAVPLDALLWFWKQLGCVAISSHETPSSKVGVSTRIIELRSAFAPTNSTGLRLVLDGRARWFRAFPSGESSSAMSVATQSFGDYRAVYDSARESVECMMYSWPTTAPSEGDAYGVSTKAHAYCWRWQLMPTPRGSTTATALQVQLVVERGSLERRKNPQALALEPLARKCDCVAKWDRVLLADWTVEA